MTNLINIIDYVDEEGICTLPVGTPLFRLSQSVELKPKIRFSNEYQKYGVFTSTCIYIPLMMIPENGTQYNFLSVYRTITEIKLSFQFKHQGLKNHIIYSGPMHCSETILQRNGDNNFKKHMVEVFITDPDNLEFVESYFVTNRMWQDFRKLISGVSYKSYDSCIMNLMSYEPLEFLNSSYSKYAIKHESDSLIIPVVIPKFMYATYDMTGKDFPCYSSNLTVKLRRLYRQHNEFKGGKNVSISWSKLHTFPNAKSEYRIFQNEYTTEIVKFDFKGSISKVVLIEKLIIN